MVRLGIFILLLLMLPAPKVGAGQTSADAVRSTMALFNTYMRGISIELEHPEPQVGQLFIFSELLLDAGEKLKIEKRDRHFHENLRTLLRDAASLRKLSLAGNDPAAINQAKSIKNNCIGCHLSLTSLK